MCNRVGFARVRPSKSECARGGLSNMEENVFKRFYIDDDDDDALRRQE